MSEGSPGQGSSQHLLLKDITDRLKPLLPDEHTLSKASVGVLERLAFLGARPPPDSSLFDFEGKVDRVVAHFALDGLTREDYLRAAVKEPRLFIQKPTSIISGVERFEQYGSKCGLSRGEYLHAALAKQPSLFHQNPETLIRHVEEVVRHFGPDGLTRRDYLRAALAQPSLLGQKPTTLIHNVEAVVGHFASDGLTRRDYLRAALKRAPLFHLKPQTVIGSIEKVVHHFGPDGLTRRDYLRAALAQPSLFYQKSETVVAHLHLIAELSRKGLLGPTDPRHHRPGDDIRTALKITLKNPVLLTLSNENLMLREIYALITLTAPSLGVVTKPRKQVEQELAAALGHPTSGPVPKVGPDEGRGLHAQNLLLRALIHEGWLKGRLR